MRTPIWMIATLIGCSQNHEKPQNTDGDILDSGSSDEVNYTFDVSLASTSTVVGEFVSFTWTVVDSEGEAVDFDDVVYDMTVSDSLESDIYVSATTVQPTLVGTHDLNFSLEFDGNQLSAQASLDASVGAIEMLDLQLSTSLLEAGESTDFTVVAADRFGNPIDTSATSIGTDMLLNGTTLSETTAGYYSVSASLDGMVDTEVLQITPTAASSITLTAPTTSVEQYETLACTIEVFDEYGNVTDDPWTFWADGTGLTTITHSNVTFWDEGSYMLHAEVDGTSLSAELGPIEIDSSGPSIEILYPDRGHSTTLANEQLSGHVEDAFGTLADLFVNQQAVTPDGLGDFTEDLNFNWGLNLIETTATDTSGNESSDVRAAIHGTFLPQSASVPDGLVVRLGDNDDGLGPIEDLGETLISSSDLGSMLPANPIYSNSSGCSSWIGACLYDINLNLNNPSIGSTALNVDPKGDGTIDVNFSIYNSQVQWNANGDLIYVGTSASGTIYAYIITVDANLSPSVSNGEISMTLNSVSSSIGGFNFDMNGFLGDVLGFFGVSGLISDQIEDALKDAIEDAVQDEIPALLEDSLQDLEVTETFDIMGNTYTLLAEPSSVAVDEDGLSIGMSSQFYAANWTMGDPGLGSLYGAYAAPNWDPTTGTGISLSVDALNQLFYEVWGGGGLTMELTADDLGTDSDDLAFLFPNATDLRFTTNPLLAPVIVEQNGALELQLGDIGLTLHNGDIGNGDIRLEVYMSLTAPLDMTTDGVTLSATLGTPVLSTDVIYPQSIYAADTEVLLSEIAPLLLPILTEALGEITIPNIQGFNIQNLNLNVQSGNLVMVGSLSN